MQPTERSFVRRIDLTSLQLFVAVGEAGSIGKAAEREFIAPSAVSKRLADLESALGTPLLYRHARGVDLTPAGQSLLHHARKLLWGLEEMQGELSEYATGVRGHIRMHASISATVQFLPDDLGSFVQQHPQVKIDLEEHLSANVARAVQEGTADVGVCNASALPAGSHGLQTLPYRQDRLALVAPATHPLTAQATLHFADTLAYDHVGLHAGSSIALAMQHAAAQSMQPIRLRIRVAGLEAMCRMIANGLGVGVMPLRAFELMHSGNTLRAVPLADTWAWRHIVLLARDFGTLPITARTLVSHLCQTSPANAAPDTASVCM